MERASSLSAGFYSDRNEPRPLGGQNTRAATRNCEPMRDSWRVRRHAALGFARAQREARHCRDADGVWSCLGDVHDADVRARASKARLRRGVCVRLRAVEQLRVLSGHVAVRRRRGDLDLDRAPTLPPTTPRRPVTTPPSRARPLERASSPWSSGSPARRVGRRRLSPGGIRRPSRLSRSRDAPTRRRGVRRRFR